MNLLDIIRNSWNILGHNKIRSFLTMLGIIIGVMAVVVIMSVGAGAQSLILNQIKGLGSNLVGVLPGKSDDKGPPAMVFGILITTLTNDDGRALMNAGNSHLVAETAYVRGAATARSNELSDDTTFVGVNASFPRVESISVSEGSFFSDEDERSANRVAVLGSEAAQNLFPNGNAVGQFIKLKQSSFQVVGVLAKRGTTAFQNQDDQIFVPLSTAQKILLGINYVNFIRVKVDSADNVDDAVNFIREIIRSRHQITNPDNDDFSVRSSNQGLDVLTSVTNVLRFFLAAIAALSLVVGGIGIMNIMLAAVEERTREIGLRKAVGATVKNITVQFLVETTMITFIGGVIGIILGVILSVIVASIATSQGYQWDLVIAPSSIILGCLVSISIGLIFGLSPARRASQLSPIETLRYE